MTWRVAAASVVGTSHSATGAECQDRCLVQVENDPAKPLRLTIFVSDGAGSATHGGIGAELAIEAASEFVEKCCTEASELTFNDNWAAECIEAVRAKINAHATLNATMFSDYACTFLGFVASQFNTTLIQIGDGGIAIDIGAGLELPITPMIGEYTNMTNFVTDENVIDIMAVKLFSARPEKVAVFSDGIQRLALNMVTNTVYTPFFTPFFTVLATVTAEQEDILQTKLEQFLQSPAVNERTDDDKTLVLAHWVG